MVGETPVRRAARCGFGILVASCRGAVPIHVVADWVGITPNDLMKIEGGNGYMVRKTCHVKLVKVLRRRKLMTASQLDGSREHLRKFLPSPVATGSKESVRIHRPHRRKGQMMAAGA